MLHAVRSAGFLSVLCVRDFTISIAILRKSQPHCSVVDLGLSVYRESSAMIVSFFGVFMRCI